MRAVLFAAFALLASAAQAQTVWQINAAYQNQINQAQWAAQPVYGYGYAPAYVAPRPLGYGYYGGGGFNRTFNDRMNAMRIESAINRQTWAQEQSASDIRRAIKNASFEQSMNEMRRQAWDR